MELKPQPPVMNQQTEAESLDASNQAVQSHQIIGAQPNAGQELGVKAQKRNLALWTTIAAICVLLFLALVGYLIIKSQKSEVVSGNANQISEQLDSTFSTVGVDQLNLGQLGTVDVNGVLTVNSGLVLAPSSSPDEPVNGQLYYDADDNRLRYYDGQDFQDVSVDSGTVNSLGGVSGDIAIGNGLALQGNTLSANTIQAIAEETGVSSIQGLDGDVSFTAGNGITIAGTTISNSGITSLGGRTGAINIGTGLTLVGNTLVNNGSGTVVSVVGTANQVNASTSLGVVTLSTPQNIHSGASPTFNGLTLSGLGNGIVQSTAGALSSGVIDRNSATLFVNDLSVANGGTGASDATTARSNLGAAASGANSDITSLSGLTTALSVGQGGTGATSLTQYGVLIGDGSNPISSVATGTAGLCLISNSGANPSWQACPGGGGGVTSLEGLTGAININNASGSGSTITIDDATTAAKGIASFSSSDFSVSSGAVSLATDSVGSAEIATNAVDSDEIATDAVGSSEISTGAVGTDEIANGTITTTDISGTAGITNGQLANSSLTVTASTGLSGGGLVSLGGSVSLTVDYGASAGSAVQGNTTLVCPSGSSGLAGGGNTITLGSGGTCTAVTLDYTATLAGDPTLGANGSSFASTGLIFEGSTADTNEILLTAADPDADRTITLPNQSGTVCLTTGNCVGVGGSGDILNGGQDGAVTIGTNDANTLTLETNDTARLTITSAGVASFSGNLSTTGSGTITSAGALTVSSGGASITGGLNNNTGGITNAGAVSGASTITASSTINTTGGSIQTNSTDRITNAGGLTNITGYSQSSGNFSQSGAGTFGTGTGAVSLNGNTSVTGSGTFSVNSGQSTFGGGVDITSAGSLATRAGTTFTTPGSSDNVAISTASLYLLDTSGAAQTITGIVAGSDGQRLTLVNADTGNNVTLANQSGSSLAANRITTGTGVDVTLAPGSSIDLIYDSTSSLWRVTGGVAGGNGTCSGCANTSLSNLSGVNINTALNATSANLTLQTTTSGDVVLISASGNIDLQDNLANSTGNLVLDDTVDIGSATTGLNITTDGVITDLDDSLVQFGQSLSVTGGATFSGALAVNTASGITTTSTGTVALFNTNAVGLNIGGAVNATGINLAGGSGDTGCTIDGSNGNLTCAGSITGGSTGTVGYWSRSGTTLQPATAGDNVTTSGNISTTGSGTISSAGALTVSSGGASITGGIDNNSGGITEAGAVSGASTITASSTINTTGGAIQTNSTDRITNAGGLTNITGYSQSSGTFAFSGGGNFSIDSSAFDVNTSGVISGVTGYSQTGNFAQSGAGTFSTGTGTVSLNGATTASSTLSVTGVTNANGGLNTIYTRSLGAEQDSGGSTGWQNIGTFSGASSGARFELTILGAEGYGQAQTEHGETIILGSIANNSSGLVANIQGSWYSVGGDPVVTDVKFVENGDRNTYDVYANFGTFSRHSVFARTHLGTWANAWTSVADPGADSSTVKQAVNQFGLTAATAAIDGNLTVTGTILNGSGNLVLDDTVDIGSATTGIRVATDGSILDINGDLVLNDQLALGSSSTGLQITTAGTITDIDGSTVNFGEAISVTGGATFSGALAVNTASGITTTSTGTVALFNSNATGLNIGGDVDGTGINFAGGSGSTGCTIDGSNGNLTCSGTIQGSTAYLAKNSNDTSSASYAGNLYSFTNTNTGAAGVLSLQNSGTNAALQVTQTGNTSASSSTGGAINLNNTSNTGAGLVIYSNQDSTASGALLSVRADNAGFDQSAIYTSYDGTVNAVNIVNTGTGTGNGALNLTSTNTEESTLKISGTETGRGTIKVTHTGTGSDGNASALSIDLKGVGTAAQGIFIDATDGGTTGTLLNIRNGGGSNQRLSLTAAGQLQLQVQGSTGGIQVGTDTQLYRGAANRLDLASGDSLNIVSGGLAQTGGAVTLSANSASSLTTSSGNLTLDATSGSATIEIGTGGQNKTVQIGNTANAVTQTINIGNNATASSVSNVNIGSTIGASATLIQSGTGDIIARTADVFRIQNTSTTDLFQVDTGSSQIVAGADIIAGSSPTSSGATLVSGDRDTGTDMGLYTSIAIGSDGYAVIAHHDESNGDLRVTKCSNESCSSSSSNIIDNSATDVGEYSDIAIGSNGYPVISYVDSTNDYVKVRYCTSHDCTSGSTNNIDTGAYVKSHTSIDIGSDGYPIVSFYDAVSEDLEVVKCGNASCSSGNTASTPDSTGNVGAYSNIIVPSDGRPIISHSNASLDLRYTRCGNSSCSAGNSSSNISTASDVSSYASMTLVGDGTPLIAHHDFTLGDLVVTKCNSLDCDTPSTSTVANSGYVGEYASIATGSDGLAIITYWNSGDGELKTIKCGNYACNSGNITSAPDSPTNSGTHASTAVLPSGLPIIAHYNDDTSNMRVTRCGNAACDGDSYVYSGGYNIGNSTNYFNSIYAYRYYGKNLTISNFDVAEEYKVEDQSIVAGEILSINPGTGKLKRATGNDRNYIFGIVSTEPGLALRDYEANHQDTRLVALVGRVPLKTTGTINIGDPITIDPNNPGKGIKATTPGLIVGRAMESTQNGGTIEVFVQTQYYSPTEEIQGTAYTMMTNLNVSGELRTAKLTVNGPTNLNGKLTINGHIVTAGNTPTVSDLTAIGANAVVTVEGNDSAGIISIETQTGDTITAGDIAELVFANSYANKPKVIVTPVGSGSSSLAPYVDQTQTGFTLGVVNQPEEAKTYRFNYFVVE